MGYYSEYLDRKLDAQELSAERKKQLIKISSIRDGRDILVYAADLNKGDSNIAINFDDLLPISDQLSNLKGEFLDLIIQTPGGSGEIAEDIVRIIRGKYKEVAVIVPGYAKSAGTLISMAADEILMGPSSALGPIDAQMSWHGKIFSAEALLEGMEKIKKEVEETHVLNKAYIPVLQGISPGELQSAQNALDFAEKLVTDWLADIKFKNWDKHSSTGNPVTKAEKIQRAKDISKRLRDHGHWLTHGRSIKIEDLEEMKLRITNYSEIPDLNEAISRYYALLQITFGSNIYKVFETPKSQIYKHKVVGVPIPQTKDVQKAKVEMGCGRCGHKNIIQANLGKQQPLEKDAIPFPANNMAKCIKCGSETDVSDLRRQIEAQSKKKIVS